MTDKIILAQDCKNEFNQFPGTHFFGIFSVIFSFLQKNIFADFRK